MGDLLRFSGGCPEFPVTVLLALAPCRRAVHAAVRGAGGVGRGGGGGPAALGDAVWPPRPSLRPLPAHHLETAREQGGAHLQGAVKNPGPAALLLLLFLFSYTPPSL